MFLIMQLNVHRLREPHYDESEYLFDAVILGASDLLN